MGAAKNRKAEIAQLKANGPKVQKCLSFGAFYKDDEDCGWSFNFDREELGNNSFQFCYDQHIKLVKAELAQLRSGNFDYFDGSVNEEDAIESLWKQTKDVIHDFNIYAFGTPVRPDRSTGLKVNLSNRDIIRAVTMLMGNIALLTELGEIKNDEYNGMLFMYE